MAGSDFRMIAQTMYGLEAVLGRELLKLGAREIKELNRAVSFVGDAGFMYKANFCLRTALRVLLPIGTFTITSQKDYYEQIREFAWEKFMSADDTLAIRSSLNSDHFDHTQYASQLAKDGIVDRFREMTGKRPSVDLDDPMIAIHVHIDGDHVQLSLDSSGEALFKRGYRDRTNLAPMNEVLAAGLVQLSGWDRRSAFVDPMCGSGTLLMEAAMLAANIPAGYYRKRFGFQKWADFDQELWDKVVDGAIGKINDEMPVILGGELSSNVARIAKTTVATAELSDAITIRNVPFQELEPPAARGVMILNPPYGERMVKDDINELYKMIGDTLKKRWQGYEAWLITSNLEAAKHVHLTAKPRIKLYNGSLECRFMRYELYDGSRKVPRTPREVNDQ
jgi:putative N6-adenine-specific DNA methylase